MPLDVAPNQDFLKFISLQKDKKNFQNLELLLNLEKNYPGIFIKVMSNFDEVKSYRESLDENGKPIIVPWDEVLLKFYLRNKYIGVTKENADIAELFGRKSISQELFNEANELRQIAKKLKTPEHILGRPIKEETILESIEKIRNQTKQELASAREMIEELYDKQFTYEWLSKNDPQNAIMGLFCDCCGSIASETYGEGIAKASILAPDVQNLVVRNSKGEIVSKGTMYVNKDKGYAVINDFELNKKYKNHERLPGQYAVADTSSEEQDREMIFKAFKRGLRAFIEEYDRQNPEKPLKQINIGMGFNRLRKQVQRFKDSTVNLQVPYEYNFKDAMEHAQYILYQREQDENIQEQKEQDSTENGGVDR